MKELETDGKSIPEQPIQNIGASDEISWHREELDSLQQQTKVECDALRLLRSEYDSAQRDMELLLETIDKRRQLLDSLDSQLDSELTARRYDIEVQFICG